MSPARIRMEKTSALLIAVIGIIFLDNRLTSSTALMGTMIISFCTFISCIITFSTWVRHSLFSTWKGQNTAAVVMAHLEPCPDQVNERTLLLRGEVEVVMEKLGILYDPSSDEIREKLGSDDIADLLDEKELGLEEAKEAFDVFDENTDGFIDGNELEKVLCKLGFEGFSGKECERMIGAFDENRDGVIDFSEFVKLMEKCSW
ncbi:probable calcium-binding protein CML45 [Rhododendron vialii]|uniref:probable calcium-binding protein CML45 n=1 Tax=Rhododendron vialii TaxID=182163 RepID=UPI00265EDB0C|nr:probable calcium-binding protein CML45 [Rhododendron vialii]